MACVKENSNEIDTLCCVDFGVCLSAMIIQYNM